MKNPRGLFGYIRLYWVINQSYRTVRFPRLEAVHDGWRAWLDTLSFLERPRSCGCVDLGGGGRRYCTVQHLLYELERR